MPRDDNDVCCAKRFALYAIPNGNPNTTTTTAATGAMLLRRLLLLGLLLMVPVQTVLQFAAA